MIHAEIKLVNICDRHNVLKKINQMYDEPNFINRILLP